MGDRNVNFQSSVTEKCKMQIKLDTYDVTNVIKTPTCFKAANPTFIDVILTKSPNRVASSIRIDTGISDFHYMTCI